MTDQLPPSSPPALALRVGTANKIDRSNQYTRADANELLRSLNTAWTKIRTLEVASLNKDAKIIDLQAKVRRYRVGYTTLIAIITGLCWEGVRALVPIVLRWIGLM